MDDLIHCIYASAAARPLDKVELMEILRRSRSNNAAGDVTGMLLHSEGSFFQILEGPAAAVDGLLARIAADPRHQAVVLILREPIPRRAFADWSMGLVEMSQAELAERAGLNDFFARGSCLAQLPAGRAKRLLHAFADGRWHRAEPERTRRPA